MSDLPGPDRLVIRSDLAELGRLTEFIDRFCDRSGVTAQGRFRISLIAEELVTNVIVHGYGEGADGVIAIGLRRRADARIALRIADSAPAFDPRSGPPAVDTTLDLEARAVGGLGVHLARSLAERIVHRFSRGRNVVLALVGTT